MSNFDVAFDWMMDNEDTQRKCEIVSDAPPGAHAISGINSYSFPSAFRRIAALPPASRMTAVSDFYLVYFWIPGSLALLNSDEIAKRVFDAAINMGSHTAVKLLQSCLGPSIEPDGIWGPLTVTAVNEADLNALVEAFKTARADHYRKIVQNNPESEKYLKGWLARCVK